MIDLEDLHKKYVSWAEARTVAGRALGAGYLAEVIPALINEIKRLRGETETSTLAELHRQLYEAHAEADLLARQREAIINLADRATRRDKVGHVSAVDLYEAILCDPADVSEPNERRHCGAHEGD